MKIRRFFKVSPAAFALLLTTGTVRAQTVAVSVPIEENLQKGEVCDQKLEAEEALRYYLPLEKVQPKNCHLLSCIARQYRHLMTDASSRPEKLKLGGMALDYS